MEFPEGHFLKDLLPEFSFYGGLGLSIAAYGLRFSGYWTVIDLTKCDGCKGLETPLCVSACRQKNEANFPEPVKPIQPYWPQTKYEDWSDKRGLITRLTPDNWHYVEHVQVEHNGKKEGIYVLRRCMHCDNPTCQKLCPFSAIKKDENGAVTINENICFGGANAGTSVRGGFHNVRRAWGYTWKLHLPSPAEA
jgi:Fe-S-cluster-containing hydrogenase component 2